MAFILANVLHARMKMCIINNITKKENLGNSLISFFKSTVNCGNAVKRKYKLPSASN